MACCPMGKVDWFKKSSYGDGICCSNWPWDPNTRPVIGWYVDEDNHAIIIPGDEYLFPLGLTALPCVCMLLCILAPNLYAQAFILFETDNTLRLESKTKNCCFEALNFYRKSVVSAKVETRFLSESRGQEMCVKLESSQGSVDETLWIPTKGMMITNLTERLQSLVDLINRKVSEINERNGSGGGNNNNYNNYNNNGKMPSAPAFTNNFNNGDNNNNNNNNMNNDSTNNINNVSFNPYDAPILVEAVLVPEPQTMIARKNIEPMSFSKSDNQQPASHDNVQY